MNPFRFPLPLTLAAAWLGLGLISLPLPAWFPVAPAPASTVEPPSAALEQLLDQHDYVAAIPLLKAAAKRGNGDAALTLGLMHLTGAGVSIDSVAGLAWFERAADLGNVAAERHLCSIGLRTAVAFDDLEVVSPSPAPPLWRPEFGTVVKRHIEPDWTPSVEWNRANAEKADPLALLNLAQLTLLVPEILHSHVEDYPARLREAGEAGSPEALRLLELNYANGSLHFPADPTLAEHYKRLAAAAGVAAAQVEVARDFLSGAHQRPVDFTVARDWLERAARQKDPDALNQLADILRNERVKFHDPVRAFQLYLEGAAMEDIFSINDLGWVYEYGVGTPVDLAQARATYLRSAERGNVWGMHRLALLYLDGKGGPPDIPQALSLLQESANLNPTWAAPTLGRFYTDGVHTPPDPALAFEWLEKAAHAGDATAQTEVGLRLLHGLGVPAEPDRAIAWFELAAAAHRREAMQQLEDIYAGGQYDIPRDDTKARQWRLARELEDKASRTVEIAQLAVAQPQSDATRAAMRDFQALSKLDSGKLKLYARNLTLYPLLERPLPDDLIGRLVTAYEAGDIAAAEVAGDLLVLGRSDITPDPERGRELLGAAAEAGDTHAQLLLYWHYSSSNSLLYDPAAGEALLIRHLADNPAFAAALRIEFEHQANRSLGAGLVPETSASPPPPIDLLSAHRQATDLHDPDESELNRRRAPLLERPGDAPPIVIFQCKPNYPVAKRRVGQSGTVLIGFIVDREGLPRNLEVIESSDAIFDVFALRALARWRFAPGMRDGQPVNTRLKVPIVFSLTDA